MNLEGSNLVNIDIFECRWLLAGLLLNLATGRPTKFSNQNTKIALSGAVMYLEGSNLVKIHNFGFWWLLACPLRNSATGGQLSLATKTQKWIFKELS